ncbi:hypothetical protein EUTSA_v10022427mg [Eutrema salsugineum]|uniref:Mitochondrial transcription termination factor family protein n=1 Tax=Eutrema salsugineum TaxID=72664 RepID=V4MAS1_EUTSA|nr:uncharacterized protein LOC18024021 [Eutrema salsugineum]ESQ49508.1 hypothetical protein EUTSA_v10022427mg [Eutrema salsugineum]
MSSLILHGKRCNLRIISVKLMQNASAFCNSFSSASVVESLGLTTKPAVSITTKGNPDPVLSLLTSYGFTDSQISRIISTYPRLLTLDAEKSLLPKLQALQSRGASSSELTEIVSKVPKILGKRGAKSTGLYYDFIKDIIHNDKDEEEEEEEEGYKSSKCEKICYSLPVGKKGNKIRNVSALRELGVPQRFLFTLLISKSQPVWGKEKFEESVKKVVDMGFDPTTSKFVQALHVVYEMSEKTIQDKVNVYKSLGFAEEEVWEIFNKWPYSLKFSERKITQTFETLKKCGLVEEEVLSVLKKRPECMRASEEKIVNCVETFLGLGFSGDEVVAMVKCFPTCFGLSAETVKKKTEFLVKEMNWSLKDVAAIPPVLGYSLEKRIVPRCNVIKALLSKGLIRGGKRNLPMSSVLTSSNKVFVNRFVMKHGNLVPELMAIFTGDKKGTHHTSTTMKNVAA